MYIFPDPQVSHRNGMTLRDYYAGQALVGRLADGTDRDYESVAEEAYMYANAMLIARGEP